MGEVASTPTRPLEHVLEGRSPQTGRARLDPGSLRALLRVIRPVGACFHIRAMGQLARTVAVKPLPQCSALQRVREDKCQGHRAGTERVQPSWASSLYSGPQWMR